jgi:hypothetical protein
MTPHSRYRDTLWETPRLAGERQVVVNQSAILRSDERATRALTHTHTRARVKRNEKAQRGHTTHEPTNRPPPPPPVVEFERKWRREVRRDVFCVALAEEFCAMSWLDRRRGSARIRSEISRSRIGATSIQPQSQPADVLMIAGEAFIAVLSYGGHTSTSS